METDDYWAQYQQQNSEEYDQMQQSGKQKKDETKPADQTEKANPPSTQTDKPSESQQEGSNKQSSSQDTKAKEVTETKQQQASQQQKETVQSQKPQETHKSDESQEPAKPSEPQKQIETEELDQAQEPTQASQEATQASQEATQASQEANQQNIPQVDSEQGAPAEASEGPSEEELNKSYDDWVSKVEVLKQNGNAEYKNQEFSKAYLQYHDAIQDIFKFYQTFPQCKNIDIRNKLQELRVNCQNNACQCCLKLGRYSDAILIADEVIRNNPISAKAMFRKGEALMHLGEYKESIKCLTNAAKLAPNDALIRKTLEQAKQLKSEYENKEKLMYQQAMQEPVAKQEEDEEDAAAQSQSLAVKVGVLLGVIGLSATAYFAYKKFQKN